MATTVVPVTLAQAATEPEFADITSSRALPNRNVKQQFIDGGSTPGNQPDNVSPVEKLLSKFQTLSECCREVLPGVSGAAVLPYSSGEPDDTPCKDSVSLHHRNASVALAVMNART